MFKVFHAGDWHIGPLQGPVEDGVNLREKDTEKCLNRLVEKVLEEKPELVLVPGDLFHTGKIWGDRQSREVITAKRAIEKMRTAAKCIIIMRGTPNHDGSGQFALLKEFFENDKDVHVVDAPDVIHTTWADIAVIPGFEKGVFRSQNAGLGKEEENEALSQELSNIALGLKAMCRNDVPAILMAHYTVPGCLDAGSHSRLLAAVEPVLTMETLEAAGYDLVALGHIHKPQNIENNIFYSGSLNALTFNDEGDEKGFWIHYFDGTEKAWLTDSEFVKTPHREFLTMHMDDKDIAAINEGRIDEVAMEKWRMDGCIQNRIVRVFYECTDSHSKAFNKSVLQDALLEDGAFMAQALPERNGLSVDHTGMDKHVDPEENLKIYLENNGREAADVDRLIELGRPIIAEAVASGTVGESVGVFEPIEITVNNYRTYEEETFDFSNITFCTINGQNGAGKSSLFMDAILDCIYEKPREGDIARKMNEVPWLRRGEKVHKGFISFTFRIGEKEYRIVRSRTKSGKLTLNLSELVDGQWEDRSREKNTDTQIEIENLIGMDCSTFKSCGLIMQDNYGLFMEAKSNDRMKILSNLLGLEIYEGMEKIAGGKSKDLRSSLSAKEKEIDIQRGNIKTIGNPQVEIENLKELISAEEEKRKRINVRMQLLRERLAAEAQAEQRCREIRGEIAELEHRKMMMDQNISNLKQNLLVVERALAEEESIVKAAGEYRSLLARDKELLEQTAIYSAKENEKRMVEQDVESAEKMIEKLNADIQSACQEIELLRGQADLESVQEKAAAYEEKKKELDALYQKRADLSVLNQELQSAIHEKAMKVKGFEQEEQLLWSASEELRKKEELLGNSGCIDTAKASCRFLMDAVAARDELKTFPEKFDELEKRRAAEEKACQDKIEEAQGRIDLLGWNQDKFDETLAEYTDLQPYVKKLEQLQEQKRRIAVLESLIAQNEEMLKTHEEKLSMVKLRLLSIETELNQNRAAFDEHAAIQQKLPELEKAAERERELPVLREKKRNCEGRIEEIERDLARISEDVTRKKAVLFAEEDKILQIKTTGFPDTEEALQSEIDYCDGRIGSYRTKMGALEQKQKDANRMAARIRKLQEEKNEVAASLADYEALRTAFSFDGIPHQIIKKILPRMENIASSILGQMTAGKTSLRFATERVKKSDKKKEEVTLDVVIEELGGNSLPYLSKSGGEKVKASLAVNLALAEIKSSAAGIRLGMLFIDEPPFLDSDGIQAYCDALEMIRERYSAVKVMAITHDISMKSRFPQSVEVVKTDQGAKVVME